MSDRPADAAASRPATVMQSGRAKAYRPIPAADRESALTAGLAAYDRGDFFAAHEILEPAWMGTDDLAEREFYQGLIKLAAAFVHSVRANPLGLAKNLRGARDHLVAARDTRPAAGHGYDLDGLIEAVDERLARLALDPDDLDISPPTPRRNDQ